MGNVDTTYGTFIQKGYNDLKASNKSWNYHGVEMDVEDISIGANIYLEFEPKDRVLDAKKLGFVQTAKGNNKGRPSGVPKRSLMARGKNKGTFIDQLKGNKNPLYATQTELVDNPDKSRKGKKEQRKKMENYKDVSGGVHDVNTEPPGNKAINDIIDEYDTKINAEPDKNKKEQLANEAEREILKSEEAVTDGGLLKNRQFYGFGSFGYRYHTGTSAGYTQKNASFQDAPHFVFPNIIVDDSGQSFETTVLVVDGTMQKGLYLGSVTWGWERKTDTAGLEAELTKIEDDKSLAPDVKKDQQAKTVKDYQQKGFRLLPLELKSMGAPSESFFAAAGKWNKGGLFNNSTIDLPMTEGKIKKDKAKLFADEKSIGSTTFKEIDKDTKCRIVDQKSTGGGYYFYVRCLKKNGVLAEGWMEDKDVSTGDPAEKMSAQEADKNVKWTNLIK